MEAAATATSLTYSSSLMEAFQLLSRGGSFNKSRFKSDVNLFAVCKHFRTISIALTKIHQAKPKEEVTAPQSTTDLPASLDFFKYAKSNPKNTKSQSKTATVPENDERSTTASISKKRKRNEDDEDEDNHQSPSTLLVKHRVTTKGLNVPAQVDTFEEMGKRFSISSTLMKNIAACNYQEPTPIQQSGIPILSEVMDHS